MIRELGWRILLFAIPFAIFWSYVLLVRFRPGHTPSKTPYTLLFTIGLALFAASFVVWRFSEEAPTSGTYIPPHVENGKVVPGRIEQGR